MRIITKQQPSQTDAFKLSSRKNENFLHRRQAIQYPPANDRSLPAPDQTVLLARELGPRYLSSIQYYKYYLLLCTEYCRLTDQMKSCAGLWLLSVLLISLASLYPASSRPPYTRYKSQLHSIDIDIEIYLHSLHSGSSFKESHMVGDMAAVLQDLRDVVSCQDSSYSHSPE